MPPDDISDALEKWKPFQFFLGRWKGTASGQVGDGSVERSYSYALDNQFIEVKNRSVYPPQDSNPSGETHLDQGFISYDNDRSLYVMREFHNEGFVNQYVLESGIDSDDMFVFVTESIENISAGWRARTTLEILSDDRFRETFDLAGPDKDWACYITNEFVRSSIETDSDGVPRDAE